MTDGLDQLMVDAGLNLLRADPITPALVVFDGPPTNPTPAPPYVVVWSAVEWPADDPQRDSLDNLSQHAVVHWFCHIVAENQRSWRAIAQRVRTQLLNVRPTIAGMSPGLIRMEEGSSPPGADEVLGAVEVTGVRVFRLTCDT
jgi:hypothetical protein